MSNPDCYKLNPLQRGGTSQEQRYLKALLPSYIQMDERRIEELISFADRYAQLLTYYNTLNQPDGDWQGFLSSDLSTILAKVATRTYTTIGETFDKYLQRLEANFKIATPVQQLAILYKFLFSITLSLFREIERINAPGIFNTPIKADINGEIQGRLNSELKMLIAYYKGGTSAVPDALVSNDEVTPSPEDSFQFRDFTRILNEPFSTLWIVKDNEIDSPQNWEIYHTNHITPITNIYGDSGWSFARRTDYSLAFIKGIFNRAYEAYIRIISQASNHLQHSLEQYPNHSAHNALLLAFFHLFAYAQADLNQFTDRHIQFYFKTVLNLREKPASPDWVHILVDLAKNRETHLIQAGTPLKAGKDNTGKDLIYRVDQNFVANKAKIGSLKTIFIDRNPATGGVFDSPVANSKDGLGNEPLDPNNPLWRPFGEPQQAGVTGTTIQRSQLGWAITSPLLRLKAGKRSITFQFLFNAAPALETIPVDALVNSLQVQLSGEKQWILCPELSTQNSSALNYIQFQYSSNSESRYIAIGITLDNDVEPIVDYNPTNLDGGFDTHYPVAQIRIKPDAAKNVYELLSQVQINAIKITTTVKGLQDLLLQSDLGVLDPSQPFQPFSPRPKVGSTFYIGSHEAFSKPLDSITFDIQWLGLPTTSLSNHYSYTDKDNKSHNYVNISNDNKFKVQAEILQNGIWKSLSSTPISLFESKTDWVISPQTLSFSIASADATFDLNPFTADSETNSVNSHRTLNFSMVSADAMFDLNPFTAYSVNAKGGFVRLVLSNPPQAFGHDLFSGVYAKQVIDLSRGQESVTLPNEPYTPTIQSIKLSYQATVEIRCGNPSDRAKGQLFHLHPFGYRDVTEASPFLVPQFVHQTAIATTQSIQGALYIGIQAIKPQQTISILFQVAEGTEDPAIDPPLIVWAYLAKNEWRSLEKHILADSTNGLLDSGIIQFHIPPDANDDNTLLPKELRWLRASIAENYQAIPQLIGIHAQALRATFDDQGNDPYHLSSALKASSISKLLKSDSALKGISQPYASFGGRMQEDSQVFYNRVSERFRHKNRAIAIWDYERLVLEQFPSIYKVKCLNHTSESTELAPGSVRIVVVPDLRNIKAGNKFKPAVSNNTRSKIVQFLKNLNSAFVDLNVENPRYEAIKVNCNVAFKPGYDPLFYRDQLSTDIDKFLAPWAFNEGRGIDFGGSLHQSIILNFIENLPYIDFITDFILDVYIDGTLTQPQVSEVMTSTSRSILTSHQAHNIGFNVCVVS